MGTRGLILALLLASPALASPVEDAADAVLAAVKAGGDLKPLASRDDPDPRRVTAELLARDEREAAARFATALASVGAEHERRGRIAKAVLVFDRALEAAKAVGHHRLEAWLLGRIGGARMLTGEYAHALPALRRWAALREAAGDRAGTALAHERIGICLSELGRARESMPHIERALAHHRSKGDRAQEARVLNVLAIAHLHGDDYSMAIQVAGTALDLAEHISSEADAACALTTIGQAQDRRGTYPAALRALERALELHRKVSTPRTVAITLRSLGSVHGKLGGYPRALGRYEEAREMFREIESRRGLAVTLQAEASILLELGDHERAVSNLRRSLAIFEELEDREGAALVWSMIGLLHLERAEGEKAVVCQRRVLALLGDDSSSSERASCLENLGNALRFLGEEQGARQHLEQALAMVQELKNREGAIWILLSLARLRQSCGESQSAHEAVDRALQAARRIRNGPQTVRALELQGILHLQGSEYARATRVAQQAVRELETLTGGLAEEEGAKARAEHANIFEVGILASVRMASPVGTLTFLESGRARALLEGLGGRERLQAAAIPEELRDREWAARDRDRMALSRYRKALDDGDEVEALWEEVEEARSRIIAVHRLIQREARAQADLLYPQAAPLEEIQATLRGDEVLVLYALLAKEALALVVTAKDARIVELGETAKVTKAAEAFQRAVARPDERGVAMAPHESLPYLAKRLRKLVIEPLGLGETCRRLLVSPDGQLSYVPIAVLTDREVAYVPSGTTYRLLREKSGPRGEQVLALGDPDYGVTPDAKDLLVMRGGEALSPLPATREEATTIGDTLLIGKRATADGFREAVATRKRWRAVHLACHGRIDPERPVLSSLALTGGFLKCLDVYRMRIPADLAVLSACETARGRIYKTEGVVGFTRAFMFAGCPRVIVSLWKVDDEATKALMVTFYELWKDGGVGAAAALRKAQAHVAAQPRWSHPYFWGAWQLWGLAD